MNRIFAEMYADATEGANAAKGAMNTAATAAEEIAKRLEAVRQGTQEAVGRGIEAVHAALENSSPGSARSNRPSARPNQWSTTPPPNGRGLQGLMSIVEANLRAAGRKR